MNSRLPEPESLATSVVSHWAPPAGQIRRGVRGGKAGRVSGGGAALVPAGARGGEAPACKNMPFSRISQKSAG